MVTPMTRITERFNSISPASILVFQIGCLVIMVGASWQASLPSSSSAWTIVLFLVGWLYHVAYFGWALFCAPTSHMGGKTWTRAYQIVWVAFSMLLGAVTVAVLASEFAAISSPRRLVMRVLPLLSSIVAAMFVLPAVRLARGNGLVRYGSVLLHWIGLMAGPWVPGVPSLIQQHARPGG